MSADNWTTCPFCKREKQKAVDKAEAQLAKAYGTVDLQAFKAMEARRDLLKAEAAKQEETLREDYEIGLDENGKLDISYGGTCTVCNWSLSYEGKMDSSSEGASWTDGSVKAIEEDRKAQANPKSASYRGRS